MAYLIRIDFLQSINPLLLVLPKVEQAKNELLN